MIENWLTIVLSQSIFFRTGLLTVFIFYILIPEKVISIIVPKTLLSIMINKMLSGNLNQINTGSISDA